MGMFTQDMFLRSTYIKRDGMEQDVGIKRSASKSSFLIHSLTGEVYKWLLKQLMVGKNILFFSFLKWIDN